MRIRLLSEKQQHTSENTTTSFKALESIRDAVIIADRNGIPLYCNPAFSNLLGYTLKEIQDGGVAKLLFSDPAHGARVYEAAGQIGTWHGKVEFKTKHGESLPALLHIDLILDDDGLPNGTVTIGSDVTVRTQIQAFQRERRTLAEAQLDTLRSLTSTINLEEVFARILENLNRVIPNDAANIVLIRDGKAHLVERDGYSDKPDIASLEYAAFAPHHYDDLREILAIDGPLVIPDTQQYLAEHDDMRIHTPWLRSHVGIPIHLRGEIIGFLNVDSLVLHHSES